jgi:hypothetical protein
MTIRPSGQKEGDMVKGLAKLVNRLRHGLWAKCVDASPFQRERAATPQ